MEDEIAFEHLRCSELRNQLRRKCVAGGDDLAWLQLVGFLKEACGICGYAEREDSEVQMVKHIAATLDGFLTTISEATPLDARYLESRRHCQNAQQWRREQAESKQGERLQAVCEK